MGLGNFILRNIPCEQMLLFQIIDRYFEVIALDVRMKASQLIQKKRAAYHIVDSKCKYVITVVDPIVIIKYPPSGLNLSQAIYCYHRKGILVL